MSMLPEGWTTTTLDDLCLLNPRHDLSIDRSTEVSFIPMPSVSDTLGTIEKHEIRQLGEVRQGYTHFQDGDVIFAKITPCMENGKIAVAEGLHNGLACGSTEFHVLRTKGAIAPKLLWYFLRQKSFRDDAERHMTGAVGQRRVPAQYMKNIEISLPPLAEQRRIVAKLDSLFARTRRARAELTRIPPLVEHYKQAILAAAFRGDLTMGTAYQGGDGDHEVSPLWATPASWRWRRVTQVGDVSLGRQRSPENHQGPCMRPYVRAANITWAGWDFSDVKMMNFNERDFSRFVLRDGDVLLNEGSGSAKEVGKPAIWHDQVKDCCFQNTLLRVRPRECSSEYFYWYFMYCAISGQFAKETQGVNIHHIGKEGLANFPIPCPPPTEQSAIVRGIESVFAWLNKLVAEHTRATHLLPKFEQALLAKAFRGELVPQDPNDEPAAALLERIRSERAGQS